MKSNKKQGKNRKSKLKQKQQQPPSSKSSSSSSKSSKSTTKSTTKPSSFPTHLLSLPHGNNSKNGKTNNGNGTSESTLNNYNYNYNYYRHEQQQQQQKQKLITIVPNAVFISRNFFSIEECNAWIQFAEENVGFTSVSNPQTKDYAHRQCGRIQMNNDWTMAKLLYTRMKSLVEEVTTQVSSSSSVPSSSSSFFFGRKDYKPICCNGNLRLYKYEKNMSFGRHYDGSNRIERFKNGNTEITVLIYLSSCEGGATRFHLPHKQQKKKKKKKSNIDANVNVDVVAEQFVEDDGNGIAFVPEAGAILMHMHGDRCLEHEADPVLRGVKYILRTDIVYSNQDDNNDDDL